MSRDMILNRIKRNVRAESDRVLDVNTRLAGMVTRGRRQDWVTLDKTKLVDTFIEKAELANATTARVKTTKDLTKAAADWLKSNDAPLTLKCGLDPLIEEAGFFKSRTLSATKGIAVDQDSCGLSVAQFGVAESGTLVLFSGQNNPTTLNFLPPNHMVIVREKDILATYEEGWERLRREAGRNMLPRTINYITGPSRSADIEQTLLLGAHGPKRLHILVLASDA